MAAGSEGQFPGKMEDGNADGGHVWAARPAPCCRFPTGVSIVDACARLGCNYFAWRAVGWYCAVLAVIGPVRPRPVAMLVLHMETFAFPAPWQL